MDEGKCICEICKKNPYNGRICLDCHKEMLKQARRDLLDELVKEGFHPEQIYLHVMEKRKELKGEE